MIRANPLTADLGQQVGKALDRPSRGALQALRVAQQPVCLLDDNDVAQAYLLGVQPVADSDGLTESCQEQTHVQGPVCVAAEVLQFEHHVALQHLGER